jgi:hypothetical protein
LILPTCFSIPERPGTLAAKKWTDDVSQEIKKHGLDQIIRETKTTFIAAK